MQKGHTGWIINDLNPIWVTLLGRSQLSNPWDLPCFLFGGSGGDGVGDTVAPFIELLDITDGLHQIVTFIFFMKFQKCWVIFSWACGNKLQWNLAQNTIIFIQWLHLIIASAKCQTFCLNLILIWQVVSDTTMKYQCSKLLPVRQPEADNFGGGPVTFLKLFFNFMFMIWDSRQQDWQLFWLSFEHWKYSPDVYLKHPMGSAQGSHTHHVRMEKDGEDSWPFWKIMVAWKKILAIQVKMLLVIGLQSILESQNLKCLLRIWIYVVCCVVCVVYLYFIQYQDTEML